MKKLNRIFYQKLLLTLLLLGSIVVVKGQTNCSQVLVDAQNLFEDGKISEIPDFMQQCMASGFNKEERIEAYKLLSMVYTFLDEDENADQAVLGLLRLDKEYTINPELDPAEFIEVFNTFRTTPVLRVDVKLGTNTNFFRVFETYETVSDPDENAGTYKSLNGFHGGIAIEIPIKEQYEIIPEVYFMSRSYNWWNDYEWRGEPTFTEQQAMILLPVYFRYKYLNWQVIPYGDIGVGVGYLLTSELTNIETPSVTGSNETPTQDFIDSRNTLNYFVSTGLGVKYKIPMGYIFAEARYGFQINRMKKLNTIPTEAENTIHYDNGIIENSFSMDFVTLQVGYAFNIYSPKKLVP
jgi:hypothetical protein